MRAVLFSLCVSLLTACGGGGGSSSTTSNSSASASSGVEISQTSINAKSTLYGSASASFSVGLTEDINTDYYIYFEMESGTESQIIEDINQSYVNDLKSDYLIEFVSSLTLGQGKYSETLNVYYCYDENCNKPFEDMPLQIDINLEITSPGTISSSVSEIDITNSLLDEVSIAKITLPIDISGVDVPKGQNLYFHVQNEDGLVLHKDTEIQAVPYDLSLYLKPDYALGEGVHKGLLTVTACYDFYCQYPIDGELNIALTYEISNEIPVDRDTYSFVGALESDNSNPLNNLFYIESENTILDDSAEIAFDLNTLTAKSTNKDSSLWITNISNRGEVLVYNNTTTFDVYQYNNGSFSFDYTLPDEYTGALHFVENKLIATEYYEYNVSSWNLDTKSSTTTNTESMFCDSGKKLFTGYIEYYGCDGASITLIDLNSNSISVDNYAYTNSDGACDYFVNNLGVYEDMTGLVTLDQCAQRTYLSNGTITKESSGVDALGEVNIIAAYNRTILVKDTDNCETSATDQNYNSVYFLCNYKIVVLNEKMDQIIKSFPYSTTLSRANDGLYIPTNILAPQGTSDIYLLTELVEGGNTQAKKYRLLKLQY